MSSLPQISARSNPALLPGLAALTDFLIDRIYGGRSITRILAHAEAEGTLAGCNWLMPEDEAEAEAAFVDALPEVPFDDPAWGWDVPPIRGAAPVGPDRLDGDARDFEEWLAQVDRDYPPDDQDPMAFPTPIRPMTPMPSRFTPGALAAVGRIALS